MGTLTRTYRDDAEIEQAWQDLLQALTPTPKEKEPAGITKHHPALITTSDLSSWEMIG